MSITNMTFSNTVLQFVSANILLLAIWCYHVDVRDIYTLVTNKPSEDALKPPDVLCMLTSCGVQTFRCLTDRKCLKALACVGPCGSDQACTFRCISQYETKPFHEFNKCILHDNKCLDLPVPENPTVCSEPQVVKRQENITTHLQGRWYIAFGFNPIYDCFPCQIFTFLHDKETKEKMVYMDYQVEIDESHELMDKLVIEGIHQTNMNEPGLLLLNGTQNGLYHEEIWRIVYIDEDIMFAHYCGEMEPWIYEGAVVFTRDSHVTQDIKDKAQSVLEGHHYQLKEFCQPRISKCTNENLRI